MDKTPHSERLHIGLYGKMNAGKSSVFNDLSGQKVSIVSDKKGTTTDPVLKTMEMKGIGPVVLMDTAGLNDLEDVLGGERVKKTKGLFLKTDVALLLVESGDRDLREEEELIESFLSLNTPVLGLITKGEDPFLLDFFKNKGLKALTYKLKGSKEELLKLLQTLEQEEEETITGSLCASGDVVMLVMPQDASAPKGRLIKPQVETTRELLDKECTIVSTTPTDMEASLNALKKAPDLIITDSQAFKEVYALRPEESKLTSFSVLYAGYKGDLPYFLEGVKTLEKLTEDSRILIAEACSHIPQQEDIGRVKLPRMLRKRFGEGLSIDILGGDEFPEDLRVYDLVLSCGACMFNKKHMMGRILRAKEQEVPMTNYGVAIAYLTGILDKVSLPL